MSDKFSIFSVKPKPFTLESGATVHIRRLSGGERADWLDAIPEASATKTMSANLDEALKLIATCLCDADGARMFNDDEIPAMRRAIDAVILESVLQEAMRFNALLPESRDDLSKKSESGEPITTSSASSPAPSA